MKILVCIDGSEQSLNVLERAAFLVKSMNDAKVTLLHVYCLNSIIISCLSNGFVSGEILKKIDGEKENKANEILTQSTKIFAEKNIKVNSLLKRGHFISTIIEIASKGNYDMVVIGSSGMSGFKKLLLGSVSNAVIQKVKSMVMIVK